MALRLKLAAPLVAIQYLAPLLQRVAVLVELPGLLRCLDCPEALAGAARITQRQVLETRLRSAHHKGITVAQGRVLQQHQTMALAVAVVLQQLVLLERARLEDRAVTAQPQPSLAPQQPTLVAAGAALLPGERKAVVEQVAVEALALLAPALLAPPERLTLAAAVVVVVSMCPAPLLRVVQAAQAS